MSHSTQSQQNVVRSNELNTLLNEFLRAGYTE